LLPKPLLPHWFFIAMAAVPLFWKVSVQDPGQLAWLRDWTAPGLIPVDDLHVTLLYLGGRTAGEAAIANDLSEEEYLRMSEALQRLDGSEVTLSVTAVLKHPEMIFARVELSGDVASAVARVEFPGDVASARAPHLTLCRSPAVRPKLAISLLGDPRSCEVHEVSPPIVLRGVVGLETGPAERPAKKEVADPTVFVGSFLRVETNARASRQTEPSGYATFLAGTEEEIQAWATCLAASVKAQPAGPASLKLKTRVQAPDKPGHIYLKWGATASDLAGQEIGAILEARHQELL